MGDNGKKGFHLQNSRGNDFNSEEGGEIFLEKNS